MSDQQPYTPTTEKVRRRYATAVYEFSIGGAVPDPDPEFDRWYQAEIAAAEQRGAARALREAADVLRSDIAISWNRHRGVMFMENESDPGVAPEEWLKRRADRMEGDE